MITHSHPSFLSVISSHQLSSFSLLSSAFGIANIANRRHFQKTREKLERNKMGFLAYPLPGHSPSNSQSQESQYHLRSESSSGSISSQSSLSSVPSLTDSTQEVGLSYPDFRCQDVATLSAHSAYISSHAIVGKFFFGGASDGKIRAWTRDTSGWSLGDDVVVACGGSAVKSMVERGEMLFSAHQDGKIRVWRLNHGQRDGDGIYPSYKFVASLPTISDRLLKFFSTRNYVQVRRNRSRTWVNHVDTVSSLALSKDGSLLYSASWDRTFKVWRTSDLRCLESVNEAHDDAINAIVVTSDGFVYTGSADKKIKVWKQKFDGGSDRKCQHVAVATLEKHRSAVNALALSEDEEMLYSGACDRSILVWERDGSRGGGEMAVVGALRGHTKAILSLAVAGEVMVSGSADKTVRVWRRGLDKAYSCLGVLEGHTKPVKCVSAREDWTVDRGGCLGSAYWVYSGGLDCNIKVWKIWVSSLF